MDRFKNDVGVGVPRVLLPEKGTDFAKWAVVACDQYTSQPEYWQKADEIVGQAPSTLRLVLPEAYLGKPDEAERIADINHTMGEYLKCGILAEQEPGFVLVTRTAGGKTRTGLVLTLDLEQYDYNKGATTLIRATEGTIVERIPPRLRIRAGAPLELPHILVLIDDPHRTVIEPLAAKKAKLPCLYDTELMLGGGHITGHLVSREADIDGVLSSLTALTDPKAFAMKYGKDKAPLLFAMGDGNHSLATAKANWEQVKAGLSADEQLEHPARYALVEIENVHDEGIVFEPIHRVVFGIFGDEAIQALLKLLKAQNGDAMVSTGKLLTPAGGETQVLPFITGETMGAFTIANPSAQLAVGTLQNAIDALLKQMPAAEVDYIHGADVVREIAGRGDAIGFLLPAMEKAELFKTVVYDGALPRKTFSMGEANEKRYYMECRRL